LLPLGLPPPLGGLFTPGLPPPGLPPPIPMPILNCTGGAEAAGGLSELGLGRRGGFGFFFLFLFSPLGHK
jgi:hypothetical protein